MSRAQHIASSGLIAAIGLWVMWISFTQQPAEAFLFPRLISVFFVGLALWTFAKALMGRSRTGAGLTRDMMLRAGAGLAMGGVYVFWAAKTVGFYAATLVAVFVLVGAYDGRPFSSIAAWARRAAIALGATAVLYCLFALLLGVYTPRGWFI